MYLVRILDSQIASKCTENYLNKREILESQLLHQLILLIARIPYRGTSWFAGFRTKACQVGRKYEESGIICTCT